MKGYRYIYPKEEINMDFEEFCKENNYNYEHELLKIYAFYKLIAIKMEDRTLANKYCPER